MSQEDAFYNERDFIQFIVSLAFLCIIIGGGIVLGGGLLTNTKEDNLRKCEAAFIASVVSDLDQGARHELDWITSFDPPEVVLERPECKNAIPNRTK